MSATSQRENGWVAGRFAAGTPRMRLVCLPQAGGGVGAFARWRPHLPDGVELAPVEYPGRGGPDPRPAPAGFDALVDGLFEGLRPERDLPYALFGHSFGGQLAYELTRRIEAAGEPAPLALFVSGARAPHRPPPRRLSDRGDAEIVRWLIDNGGLPLELLEYRDFLRQIIGVLRADMAFAEGYLVEEPGPVACPLHLFGGIEDRVASADGLNDWRRCAAGEFTTTVLPGGHAFPYTDPATLLGCLLAALPAEEAGPEMTASCQR